VQKTVLGLEISVDETIRVQILQALCDVSEEGDDLLEG
jgi:hypothetical protein